MLKHKIIKRAAVTLLALVFATTSAFMAIYPAASVQAAGANDITGVVFGQVYRYNNGANHYMNGDTFGNTWADDDKTYYTTCDANYMFNGQTPSKNIYISTLPDNPRTQPGTLVNSWDMFGTISQQTLDPDGVSRVWKGGPVISVGGVLYAMVDRQRYGSQEPDGKQTVYSGGIIKSTDHGVTWVNNLGQVNTPPPVTSNAMFPNPKFAAPYFIEHGKNYTATSSTYKTDTYVYAYSNDKWANDDGFTFGRVPKDKIMDKTAWQYYKGPVPTTGNEGLNEANWSNNPNDASQIYSDPGKCNYCDVKYIPGLNKYIMFNYYYPGGLANSFSTVFKFCQSDTPWGPWTTIATRSNPNSGFYIPTAPAKWISADGKNFKILYAGSWDSPSSWDRTYYQMYVQDVTLLAGSDPVPTQVNDSQTGTGTNQFNFSGGTWGYQNQASATNDDEHYSNTANNYATIAFNGTQIKYYANKAPDCGIVALSIDGGTETVVDLYDTQRICSSPVWTSPVLASGTHTMKIRVTGTKNTSSTGYYATVDRADIYGSGASTNVLSNPGFEADGSTTQTPGSWTTWTDHNDEDADYVKTDGHSGTYSLCHNKASAYRVYTYQTKTGLLNGSYTLSAWVWSGGGQPVCRMEAKDYGGTTLSANMNTADSGWRQITISGINVSNGQCTVGFLSDAQANQWVAIDDVSLIKQ